MSREGAACGRGAGPSPAGGSAYGSIGTGGAGFAVGDGGEPLPPAPLWAPQCPPPPPWAGASLGEITARLAETMVIKSPPSPLPLSGCSRGSLHPKGPIFGLLGAPVEAGTCESLTFRL